MNYETVVGLEVHAELSTETKIFCSCTNEFGGAPNTHCCPTCLGMPGTLPVLNKKVVEYAIKAGLATNCMISKYTKFDRKNYFYPDLPRAYQISQFNLPICTNGFIEIEIENVKKKIGIERIHIEEDAGKLIHDQWDGGSLVDYNRGGVPLIEIVTRPDIRSPEEARLFLESLKSILQFTEVSDCKMQEGSLRADVNVSVMPAGSKEYGVRTEMKNLNSFRAVIRAIESESQRQIKEIESGGTIHNETRRWDDGKGMSYSMRGKEEAQDYRYFPESDLPPVIIDDRWVGNIRKTLPELPEAKKDRYIQEYGIPPYDAGVITSSKELSEFFEKACQKSRNIKSISNWVMGDFLRVLKEKNMEVESVPFPPGHLAKLVNLIDKGIISGTIAKRVFEKMFDTGKDPETIVKKEGLEVVDDEGAILELVRKVISDNTGPVEDYKNGKKKALGFLVGQAMKETRGKADPRLVNEMLVNELKR